jgi:DNA-binding transcriptional ArsR family regulator
VGGHTELELDPLDSLRISVAAHQGATLLSLVADTFGGRRHGVPEPWRRLVRSAVPRASADVLKPLFGPDYSVLPDCLTPTASMPGGSVSTMCERLADLAPGVLLDELEREFGGKVPRQWRSVIDRPRLWIHAYTDVLRCVWREFRPVWGRAGGLLQWEAERLGAAVVQGCADAVLGGISGRVRLSGDSLYLPDPLADRYRLNGRRLVLVPVVSGPEASIFALDRPDLVWIGYPLPGLGRLWESSHVRRDAARDPLSLAVGPLRAAVLRATEQPLTMSELATLLGCSPANATHHCRQLVDARLLERRREGRHVRVGRTERGDAIVGLLSR